MMVKEDPIELEKTMIGVEETHQVEAD